MKQPAQIPPMSDEHMTHLEQVYRITFTDRERVLLAEGKSNALLTPIDQQRRYILLMEMTTLRCPACHGLVCKRSITPAEHLDTDKPVPDDAMVCPLCSAKLRWALGLVAGEQFLDLLPGQTITTGSQAS